MARRTKEEAQVTRDLILDMAEVEFHRRGVSRTSLQDIARAAGLTRGAIYWHFEDKADVFNAMMKRVTLPLEAEIDRSGSDDSGVDAPLEHIRQSMMAALRKTVDDPQVRRVFEIAVYRVEHVDGLQAVRERRLGGLNERLANIERGLDRAVRQGALPRGTQSRGAAIGLHSMIAGLLQNWLLDPEAFDLVRVGQQSIDAYLNGLRGAEG